MSADRILWQPDDERRRSSAMYRFLAESGFDDYDALYRWSIDDIAGFWRSLSAFVAADYDVPPEAIVRRPDDIMHAGWFDGARLNYAAHLLRRTGDAPAIIFCREDGMRRSLSFDELRSAVAGVARSLTEAGISSGDRVGAVLPNCPETVIAMLATTSLGAIWSSCSPDFGANGVVDRFGQIEPRILFGVDGYLYNGKRIDCGKTLAEIVSRIPSIEKTVVVRFMADGDAAGGVPDAIAWPDFAKPAAEYRYASVAFDHPLFIMYSSGTTGVPKCIVHGHGGTLLQHLKEHVLHTDVSADDRLFYFTTCGWMMWNWLVSGLASGATIVLFDGAPFVEEGRVLWHMAERERVSIFGTSAKYLSALEKAGRVPRSEFDLGGLRTVLSTGSPLAPASFDYVYESIADDVQLSSIAGGTDILGCFAIGNPMLPVRRGELQCRALGMAVEIFDDEGHSLVGERGELVCTRPFPSAPVGFWNDPDDNRYRAAYFERFPGVWAHGDFAELRPGGGLVIHGRSDAVLNPGGVRIGTAEIYRQVEKLDEILESVAIGQDWEDDVRVVLFVVLREGVELDEALEGRIRDQVRRNTSPRHVPAKILAVPEIPRTKSGKIVELAIREVVHGQAVKNTDALANAAALDHFRDIPALAED